METDDRNNDALLKLLTRHLVAGTLDRESALEALRVALGDHAEQPSLLELADRLDGAVEPELAALRRRTERQLLALARRARDLRLQNRPLSPLMEREFAAFPGTEKTASDALDQLAELARLRRDLAFVQHHQEDLTRLHDIIDERYLHALDAARGITLPWHVLEPLVETEPPELPPADDRPARERALLAALSDAPDRLLAVVERISGKEWEWRRVAIGLALRFGAEGNAPHDIVAAWRDASDHARAAYKRGARLCEQFPTELAAVRAALDLDISSARRRELADEIPTADVEGFIQRWSTRLTATQGRILRGESAPFALAPQGATADPDPDPDSSAEAPQGAAADTTSQPEPAPAPPETQTPVPTARSKRARPAKPPATPSSSLWSEHLRPFLLENWYVAIGALMVVVGCSLFAYFTWDRHWAFRYTVPPLLLGGFTFTLAWLGGWLERRDMTLRGTGAVLRGAAIGLLPINFMTVALLAADSAIGHPVLVVSLVAALYLVVFGIGLRRWCRAVHPALGGLLGGTLVALCALVMLRPLALTLQIGDTSVRVLLGTGFYVGFAVAAGAVVAFSRRVLTPAMARENRVPWFFGTLLVLTFVQVFLWVHASMAHLPRVATYAPMVIAAGALLLYVERRALDVVFDPAIKPAGTGHRLEAESFLGFAFILLGLVMAQAHPWVRVIGFLLAGIAWLGLATPRRDAPHGNARHDGTLHAWIGLTLLALAGASVALVPGFPSPARPWLGLALALAAGASAPFLHARGKATVAAAARDLQPALLVLTSAVGMLGQWHDRSEPLLTAAVLLVSAALLAWRAHRDQKQRWLLTATVIIAAALPYLGCVDLSGRTLHGNTMVFGLAALSLLWIGLDFVAPTRETRRARSTVLWFYGALAVVGMTLRVLVERGTPGDVLSYRALMDHSGPVLAAVALAFATYWSRSLAPAGMAAVILIILFPELKSQYHDTFESLGWGSGLASTITALALVAACFVLRGRPALQQLGTGDRFLANTPFPVQRHDWTLFTWPIAASALFLLGKNATVTLLRNADVGMTLKAGSAQFLCGMGWLGLAAYGRRYSHARFAVRFGFWQLFVGTACLYEVAATVDRSAAATPLLYGLLILALLLVTRRWGVSRWPWLEDLIAKPAHMLLRGGTVVIGVLLLASLFVSVPDVWAYSLIVFLIAQCAWHGLAPVRKTGRRYSRPSHRYGVLLILLVWVGTLYATQSSDLTLLDQLLLPLHRLHVARITALLVLAVQVPYALAELRPTLFRFGAALLRPFQGWAIVAATGVGAWLLRETFTGAVLDGWSLILGTLALLATARASTSGTLAAFGCLLGYVLACLPQINANPSVETRLIVFTVPWRWALCGLAIGLATRAGQLLFRRAPRLIAGTQPASLDPLPAPYPLLTLAGLFALAASLQHLAPAYREAAVQLAAPYLGALTFVAIASVLRAPRALYATAFLLAAGNVHAVRVLAGPWLTNHGVTAIQLVAIGLGATVAAGVAVRRLVRNASVVRIADHTVAAGAAIVLLLLAAQYVAHPDIAAFTHARLLASGALAYLAALALRDLARHPSKADPLPVEFAESGYHLGLTVALWCLALLVPALRRPAAALVALSVPFLFFLARAEIAHRRSDPSVARLRRTATVLGFGLLGLYLLRSVFQIVLFPGTPVLTDHYHVNAPLVMMLGLALIRLHALDQTTRGPGASYWVAFYGGLALMVGSYFAITAVPGYSPFDGAIKSGWVALALGHFWTAATAQRSPLSAGLQRLGNLGGPDLLDWHSLRRGWGVVLLVATQWPPLHAALHAQASTYAIAPLLAGSASIVLHHGLVRRQPLYLGVAALQILLALHLGFLVPSYIAWPWIVWILLGAWIALILRGRPVRVIARASFAAAGLVFFHVQVHGPASAEGLGAFAAATALLLATPQRDSRWRAGRDDWLGGLLLAPVWLAYLLALPHPPASGDWWRAWPVLFAAATLLATGAAASWVQRRYGTPAAAAPAPPQTNARLWHRVVSLLRIHGRTAGTIALYTSFAAACAVFLLHYGQPYSTRSLALLCGLFAACAAGFHVEGQERRAMLPYFLLQLACVAFFATMRRQLVLTTDFWTVEYDVWAACTTTLALAGAKEVFDLAPRERNIPVTTALFVLPVVAMIWTQVHGLGTNVALLVIGLHSLVYSFLGRDDRESPYHLVAIAGFVAFVVLTLTTRLELRSVQAYTLPTGLGILVLTQMFRGRMSAAAKNRVRLVAVITMIGTSGYEALLDPRYPIGFHVTLILLGLLAMALGGFLKVRVYLVAGAGAVLAALGSIVYRGLAGLERAARMSTIGVLVLVVGSLLVAGAIYYKTHRTAINERVDQLRRRFGDWD